jgi:hypothetical protein
MDNEFLFIGLNAIKTEHAKTPTDKTLSAFSFHVKSYPYVYNLIKINMFSYDDNADDI